MKGYSSIRTAVIRLPVDGKAFCVDRLPGHARGTSVCGTKHNITPYTVIASTVVLLSVTNLSHRSVCSNSDISNVVSTRVNTHVSVYDVFVLFLE